MDRKRILELALERLQQQRIALEAEIQTVRAELHGRTGTANAIKAGSITPPPSGRRKPRTAAQRKAHSARMKAYWASRRETLAANAKKAIPTTPKRRARTAAEKKALSMKMKAAWARRKAESAKKAERPLLNLGS